MLNMSIPRRFRIHFLLLAFAILISGILWIWSGKLSPAVQADAPTDADIFRNHVLEMPLVPVGGKTSPSENVALSKALTEFEKITDQDDDSPIRAFLTAFPKSAWRPALLTNLGLRYRHTGWFLKALAAWDEAWRLGKEEKSPVGKAAMDRTVGELAELNARLGRRTQLEALLKEVKGRTFVGAATEKITGAREGLGLMIHEPGSSFKCGPYALGQICAFENRHEGVQQKISEAKSTDHGTSLDQVCKLSVELGLNYQMAKRTPGSEVIIPSVVNWKANHYAALIREVNGKLLTQDPTFGGDICVSRAALDAEASGYFLVPSGPLPKGWQKIDTAEGAKIWGMGAATDHDLSGSKTIDDKCKTDCVGAGMAVYNFHTQLVSLNITDTPVGYTPPYGPDAHFTVTYNQREATDPPVLNLGHKWTFNWFAYLTIDGAQNVTVYPPGGGSETYNYVSGEYAAGFQSGAKLTQTGSSPLKFERMLPDGSREIYEGVWNSTTIFMTALADDVGNKLHFIYENGRMTQVWSDYDSSKITHISYRSDDQNAVPDYFLISQVSDPSGFNRSATFEYQNGQLWKIHDVIGLTSTFTYQSGGDFINTMTTPYGTTTFSMPPPFSDLETYGGTDNVRTLQAVFHGIDEAEDGIERLEYGNLAPNIPASETFLPNVPGVSVVNGYYNNRNSFYWDKKAMAEAAGDYTRAKLTEWLHLTQAQISNIKEREKAPLEGAVYYFYPNQSSGVYAATLNTGSSGFPNAIARVVAAAPGYSPPNVTQLWRYERNSLGKPTKITDPANRVTSYEYDSNGIDLLAVYQQNPNGQSTDPFGHSADKIASNYYDPLTEPPHRPKTITDAAGQTTTYDYNTHGQLRSVQNAKLETTHYDYGDGTSVPSGYLASITSPTFNSTQAVTSFTYDGANRVHTVTNSPDDYTVTTDYDDFDRPRHINYPDLTNKEFQYTNLDLTASKDRRDHWTYRHYNSNRQMDSITDPLGRTTIYNWCACGSLVSITDPSGNVTTFNRDVQGRVYQKVFADNSAINYLYEGQSSPNGVGTTSRLQSSTDANNQKTNYTYFEDDNLSTVSYTNVSGQLLANTPAVRFTYDPNYNRIASMIDGIGTTTYSYSSVPLSSTLGANKLHQISGPFSNDTITYTYDELGRVLSQDINGTTNSVVYDSLGRLYTNTSPLGTFTRLYETDVTPRLHSVSYPNGQTATYLYYGNDGDRRLQTLQHQTSGSVNLSQHDYSYDADGQIQAWTKLLGANEVDLSFGYDDADQLTGIYDGNLQYEYEYDDAGNKLTDSSHVPHPHTPSGAFKYYTANNLNQLDSVSTQLKPNPASDPVGITYDANGNMTYDGNNQTYEWDAANRLVAINYLNNSDRTEFAYDGLGRMRIMGANVGFTGVVQPAAPIYTTFTSAPITLPAGNYTLSFEGLNPNGGDNTAFLDAVTLNGTLVPSGGFESPNAGDFAPINYVYFPDPYLSDPIWSYPVEHTAGITGNGSYMSSETVDAPEGRQAAFIQFNGVISQTLSLSAGTYTLTFQAVQRYLVNASFQQLWVKLQPLVPSTQGKHFVWAGNALAEERDGNNNVTKRFFGEGEQRVGGIDAGNYYYTRDHLGSIREVTDSSGALKGQYDYDAWGNPVVVSGSMNIDFGYTGHYFHQPSGLNLAMYRAYNPSLGRWISRDPLKNAEMSQGTNLYAHVGNNPINATDPFGLCPGDWWDPRTWLNEGLTDSLWDTGLSISDSLGGMAATPFYGEPAWQQVMNSATYSPLGQTENNPVAYNTVWASLIVSGVADSVAGGGWVAAGWEGMSPGQKFAIVNFIMRLTTGEGDEWKPPQPRPPSPPPFIGGR